MDEPSIYSFKIEPGRKAELRLMGGLDTQLANAGVPVNQQHIDANGLCQLARVAHSAGREALVFLVRPEHAAAVREAVHAITGD
jgi:hypothetical protein